jgi:hypothetical protein
MKNVKSPKVSYMKATHEVNGLVEYGRKLHSEAVFMALLKMFRLSRLDIAILSFALREQKIATGKVK